MTAEKSIASKAAAMLLEAGLGKATGLGLILRQHRLALGLSLHAAGPQRWLIPEPARSS
jgi:hypothetical protein